MCSSRINPSFIFRAFQLGADGVLVGGCHPGDCHYNTGNLYARRRLAVTKKILEFSGMEPGRFRVEWISASEGNKFAEVVDGIYRHRLRIWVPRPSSRFHNRVGRGYDNQL